MSVGGGKVLVSVGGTSVSVLVGVGVTVLVLVANGVKVTVGVQVSVTVAVEVADGKMTGEGRFKGGALVYVSVGDGVIVGEAVG